MKRVGIIALALLATVACGGGNPNAPSAASTPTRIITLAGNLNFGAVPLNQTSTGQFTIGNSGTALLTVTGLAGPCATSFSASPTSGTIPPGGSMVVMITFTPTTTASCSGTVTVSGDQTAGTNSITVIASGTLNGVPVFSRSGVGANVFTLPSYVTTVHITGVMNGFSANFAVWSGPSTAVACGTVINGSCHLLVNELLGTGFGQTSYSATVLTGGEPVISIINASGVSWTITEVR